MTTAPALRPCPVPWCGSRHISLESFGGDKLFVARCPSCGARSPASRSQSEAIAAWNARPGDAARETAIIEAIQALIDAGDYFSARADVNDDFKADAAAILAMLAERRGAEPRGCPTPGACSCPPAPIAGLEPVAWRYRWRSKFLTYVIGEPRPDDSEPLYTAAQLEAHAAEQVRPLVEALEGLIEAVELDADEGLEGIGSYTGARLTDAKNAIRARGQV